MKSTEIVPTLWFDIRVGFIPSLEGQLYNPKIFYKLLNFNTQYLILNYGDQIAGKRYRELLMRSADKSVDNVGFMDFIPQKTKTETKAIMKYVG